jgi:hypothetical protein
MSDFDDTICQLRDLGMSKVANILRDLERDNMMLMSNNLKHRERIAEMERVANKAQAGEPVAMLERDPSIGRLRVTYEDAVCELGEGVFPLYIHPTTERRVIPEDVLSWIDSVLPVVEIFGTTPSQKQWSRDRVKEAREYLNAAPKGDV